MRPEWNPKNSELSPDAPKFLINPSTKLKGLYVSRDPQVDIKFEVFHEGKWLPVDRGIIQSDSRYLAWSSSVFRGVSIWRLAESTINDPTFQMLCYNTLSIQQQDDALDRRAGII